MHSLWSHRRSGPGHLCTPAYDAYPYSYIPHAAVLPHHPPLSIRRGGAADVHVDNHKFVVTLDVHAFSPDELTVKTSGEFLIIEGNHEEREDEHGFITRNFRRKFILPVNADRDSICCEISGDGDLKVTVSRVNPDPPGEKVHPITATGVSRGQNCGGKCGLKF